MDRTSRRIRRFAACFAMMAMSPCFAESLPHWEVGLGAGALSLPHYRGSDQRHAIVLPLPYVVYRGTYLQADREGIRGRLFDSDRLSLNLSLNGSLPVRSDDNRARAGMPGLDPTVELGPTLVGHLWRTASGDARLDLRAPLRTAITVSSSPKQVGWLFSPTLSLNWRNPAGAEGWTGGAHIGPQFGNRRYHAYFYTVPVSDATPDRPAYTAPGGYSGSQMLLTTARRFPNFWVGAFLRYDRLRGAAFQNSPLVRRDDSLSFGIGMAWMIAQSERRVAVREPDQ